MKNNGTYDDEMATWYSAVGLGMVESDCGNLYNISSGHRRKLLIVVDIFYSALWDAPFQPFCYWYVSFEPNLYQFLPEHHLTSSFYTMWPMGNSSNLSEIPRVRILQNLPGVVLTAGCVLASLKFQLTQTDLSSEYWLFDSIASPSSGSFRIAGTPSKCQSKEIPLYFIVFHTVSIHL